MFASLALALSLLGPATAPNPPGDAPISLDRITNFATVVVNHINNSIGTEALPVGVGGQVDPGVFVTIGSDRLQVFDHDSAKLSGGLVTDNTVATECRSGCPAVLFDAFQYEWLKMAVEASYLDVEIPTRVLLAAASDVPASTLIFAAYAAAETRPGAVPTLSVVLNMAGRGLRSQPIFLLPPEGLELQQGSAALGLTIEFDGELFSVRASDAAVGREKRGRSIKDVKRILAPITKRYPGKESIILVPRGNVTVGQLMTLVQAVRSDYPRIVLSLGQRVVI